MDASTKQLPKGFYFGGIHCGLSKKKNKKDLALFFSDQPCRASGVFTANLVKAASIIISQKNLKQKNNIQAIVANSGCANACTGKKGIKDAKKMSELAAKYLQLESKQVLVASTGVIGTYLPMNKIAKGIKRLSGARHAKIDGVSSRPAETDEAPAVLARRTSQGSAAVEAIMTTDTYPKFTSAELMINKRKVTVWACAKGAGMIHPDLATLLCFIFTDCAISKKMLDKILIGCVNDSFNLLSVDGVTSTNDTVFILANGMAGNLPITGYGTGYNKIYSATRDICQNLAKKIAQDGEGSTKLVRIEISGARKGDEAKTVAQSIAKSPLVKTAIFGNDPNWGRIMASIGSCGVKINPEKIDIYIGNLGVCKNGIPINFSQSTAKRILNKRDITLKINLHQGKEKIKYYTCDFTEDYVKINANYRS